MSKQENLMPELLPNGSSTIGVRLREEDRQEISKFIGRRYHMSAFLTYCTIKELRFPTGVLSDKSLYPTKASDKDKQITCTMPTSYFDEIPHSEDLPDGVLKWEFFIACGLNEVRKSGS